MKTKLSPENPNGYGRGGFAWEKIDADTKSHLDYGCYNGSFLGTLANKIKGFLFVGLYAQLCVLTERNQLGRGQTELT